MTLKGQLQNLTSDQGCVMIQVDPNMSYCTSFDAPWCGKHNEPNYHVCISSQSKVISKRCRFTDVPLRYDALGRRFSLEPLSKRRQQHDLMFVRNVHRHCIDSAYLLEHMPLAVPVRNTRRQALFHVPYARVNAVKRGLFVRIPELCNEFLDTNRETDVWSTSAAEWRRVVRKCV